MKKVLLIVLIVLLLLIGGCVAIFNSLNVEKVSITADDFHDIMAEKGYTLFDTTSQFAQYDGYMTKSFAAYKDGYQIEFYELSSSENAISMFNTNKAKFESQKENSSAYSSTNMNNYATYSLSTGGKYKYLSLINNTLVYTDIDNTHKDVVKPIIEELGY